jgi:hypothetical protein
MVASDDTLARVTRTIAQGVVGVLIAYAAEIITNFNLGEL